MATIDDIKESISQKSKEQLLERIIEIRKARRDGRSTASTRIRTEATAKKEKKEPVFNLDSLSLEELEAILLKKGAQ